MLTANNYYFAKKLKKDVTFSDFIRIYIEEHKTTDTMKRFFIEFKEISYGVVEVYAETEEEAREIADSDGTRHIKDSILELSPIISGQQDIK